jgi:hypothetical protein
MNPRALLAVALTASALLAACNNQKYVDLMTVSKTCDAEVDGLMARYEKSTDENDRSTWRDRIVTLRKKQLVMMQRIDVETMPKVKTGEMTRDAAMKERETLIADAQKRLDQATALKVGVQAAPAAAAAASAAAPAQQAPATPAAKP